MKKEIITEFPPELAKLGIVPRAINDCKGCNKPFYAVAESQVYCRTTCRRDTLNEKED